MTVLDPQAGLIAVAGDWHGDADFAHQAIRYAAKSGAEGIIHTGDFGIWPGKSGRSFLKAMCRYLRESDVWLVFVDGNHDDHWQLAELAIEPSGIRRVRENLWHLPRGFRWRWCGQTWMALGGAHSMDHQSLKLGRSWWPEETVTMAQAHHAILPGLVDYMVTHDVPAAVDVPGLRTDWNPDELRRANAHRELMQYVAESVEPRRWFHGHMHVQYTQRVRFGERNCWVHGLASNRESLEENIILIDVPRLRDVA